MNTARSPAIQAIAPPREDGVPGTRASDRAAFAVRVTGLTFAIMYGTLICLNYFVQLTLVAPALYQGNVSDSVRPFLFNVFNSFTYSVDLLGYSFMSLSTLFAAFVFRGPGLEKTASIFESADQAKACTSSAPRVTAKASPPWGSIK